MKKILSITCLAIFMLASKAYSQSNLTWKLNDNAPKDFFKTTTKFNTHLSGFANKIEADAFVEKIKLNKDIATVTTLNEDASGNCDLVFVMKEIHNDIYYISVAQKLGVGYLEVNGEKKTPSQWHAEIGRK